MLFPFHLVINLKLFEFHFPRHSNASYPSGYLFTLVPKGNTTFLKYPFFWGWLYVSGPDVINVAFLFGDVPFECTEILEFYIFSSPNLFFPYLDWPQLKLKFHEILSNWLKYRVSQESKIFDLTVPTLITFVPRSKKISGFFQVRPDTPQPFEACHYMKSEKSEFFLTFLDLGTKVIEVGSVKSKILFSQDTLLKGYPSLNHTAGVKFKNSIRWPTPVILMHFISILRPSQGLREAHLGHPCRPSLQQSHR